MTKLTIVLLLSSTNVLLAFELVVVGTGKIEIQIEILKLRLKFSTTILYLLFTLLYLQLPIVGINCSNQLLK